MRRAATILALLAAPGTAGAATYEVTTLDEFGPGSLRDAVATANASVAADTVQFDRSLAGTIPLTGAPMVVDRDLTIAGPGADRVTVSGEDGRQIFQSTVQPVGNSDPLFTFKIRGLRLTRGLAPVSSLNPFASGGGAVSAPAAAVVLEDARVDHSNAPEGTVFGAGAIFAWQVALTRSTIDSNSGTEIAAAVGLFGPAATSSIVASTITGNVAPPGVASVPAAGAIRTDGRLEVVDSTIAGNSSSAAAGGVEVNSASVEHSILAGNTGGPGSPPDCSATNGIDARYSLFGSLEGCVLSDPPGSFASRAGVDPGLGPLGANGGTTPTMVPLPGSPAIDFIPASQCPLPPIARSFDQREVRRPQGPACDAGAVEVRQPPVAAGSPPGGAAAPGGPTPAAKAPPKAGATFSQGRPGFQISATCPAGAAPCKFIASLRGSGLLARGAATVAPGATKSFGLRPTRAGIRLLDRGRRLRGRLSVTAGGRELMGSFVSLRRRATVRGR